jgi:hypothetical protein
VTPTIGSAFASEIEDSRTAFDVEKLPEAILSASKNVTADPSSWCTTGPTHEAHSAWLPVPSVSIDRRYVFREFTQPALYPSAVDSEIAFPEL